MSAKPSGMPSDPTTPVALSKMSMAEEGLAMTYWYTPISSAFHCSGVWLPTSSRMRPTLRQM